ADVFHAKPCIAQRLRCPTGRYQFHAQLTQSLRKLHKPRLVGHRQQSTPHNLQITHSMSDSICAARHAKLSAASSQLTAHSLNPLPPVSMRATSAGQSMTLSS